MTYVVDLREVEPRPLAVVRDRATRAMLVGKITGSPIWSLIRARGLANGGHNVVVYRSRVDGSFDLEIGVDVLAPFDSDAQLISTSTPGGLVATTRYTGPYDRMSGAHHAVQTLIREKDLSFSGTSWEWYGHWSDDPAALITDIFYLIAGPGPAGEESL